MTNKNPFEIRSDMLQLAKNYLDRQYELNVHMADQMFKQGVKTYEDIQEVYKMYSIEDIIEKAEQMYSFVSKKDKS
jgi:hypothetical protein